MAQEFSATLAGIQAATARALAMDPEARPRIERAVVLLALGAVDCIDNLAYRVASQTDRSTSYTVTPEGCTCEDSRRHPRQRCKHAWAVRILLAARQEAVKAALPGFTTQEMRSLLALRRQHQRQATA